MKLRTQILACGLLGALMAGAVGGIGLLATQRQAQALDRVLVAVESVHQGMDGDMMHDAIRADVLASLLAASRHDTAAADVADRELSTHSQRFEAALAKVAEHPLDADTQSRLQETLPAVRAYVEAARAVQSAARQDPAQAGGPALVAFMARFEDLETRMASLIDANEHQAQTATEDGVAAGSQARGWIGVTVLAVLLASIGAALWTARRLSAPLEMAAQASDRIAQGDLTGRMPASSQDEINALLGSLEHMRCGLRDLAGQVRRRAEEVAVSSVQLQVDSTNLIDNTQVHVATMTDSSLELQRISQEIQGSRSQSDEANRLAEAAAQVAGRGGEVVGEVVDTMQGINATSQRIHDIIGVIDGIAFQTNILALNAAVEAARAGEQGRGFAVVASEVRSLAQRSATAAQEIKALIGASVEHVARGTSLVDHAGATMQEIVASIGHVRDIMDRMSEQSRAHAKSIESVHRTVSRLDQATRDSVGLVEHNGAQAEAMVRHAEHLMAAVAGFKVGDEAGPAQAHAPVFAAA
ncbi:MAG: methyl-accepting chemotaxis protein [Leptothrix sp. (in: b-proteobacteria)]